MSRLAIFDVDGTLTTVKSCWQHVLESAGVWDSGGRENLERYLSGSLDYDAFCQADARLLRNISRVRLESYAQLIPMRKGALELLARLRLAGFEIALISTGLSLVTDRFSERQEVDYCRVNELVLSDAVCTGVAKVRVIEGDKAFHARELVAISGATEVIAFGDSMGDVGLFEVASRAYAVGEAPPALQELATAVLNDDAFATFEC